MRSDAFCSAHRPGNLAFTEFRVDFFNLQSDVSEIRRYRSS